MPYRSRPDQRPNLFALSFFSRASKSIKFRTCRAARDAQLGLFAIRLALQRRQSMHVSEVDGVTVIVATWNTREYLRVLLRAVCYFSPDSTRILVVDNASVDGTAAMVTQFFPDVHLIRLRRNVGHGLALDAAVQAASTRFIISLDVDAFPVTERWQDAVITPLRQGHTLAGAHWCGYIHPCFAAFERRHFLKRRYTFDASYTRKFRMHRRGRPSAWDAGQLLTALDPGPHLRIEPTSTIGPRELGTVFGELVYHNFFSTRSWGSEKVTVDESDAAWMKAVTTYLKVPLPEGSSFAEQLS